jgi:DNA-directed RNA polymerase specialized sigma54-like protein
LLISDILEYRNGTFYSKNIFSSLSPQDTSEIEKKTIANFIREKLGEQEDEKSLSNSDLLDLIFPTDLKVDLVIYKLKKLL